MVNELREAAVTATLALDETSGMELTERVHDRRTAVSALADGLGARAPDFARLEPDLKGRVDGLVWAEALFCVCPDLDAAAMAELARRRAPGTLNPDGGPRRTEVSTREALIAAYEQAQQAASESENPPTQQAIAELMSISTDTLYRMRKDFRIS